MWIDGDVMHAHFIVEMGTGGATRLANVSNHLSARNVLAGEHGNRREVAVDRQYIVAMVENHLTPVPCAH